MRLEAIQRRSEGALRHNGTMGATKRWVQYSKGRNGPLMRSGVCVKVKDLSNKQILTIFYAVIMWWNGRGRHGLTVPYISKVVSCVAGATYGPMLMDRVLKALSESGFAGCFHCYDVGTVVYDAQCSELRNQSYKTELSGHREDARQSCVEARESGGGNFSIMTHPRRWSDKDCYLRQACLVARGRERPELLEKAKKMVEREGLK